MSQEQIKLYFSYNQIHETVKQGAKKISRTGFNPHLLLAIGGGGFIPARILRTFLKATSGRTIPIQAIGLTLYEHDDSCDPLATERAVRKTQWLNYGSHEAAVSLQGKHILIVDEVDDTRKTLAYAVEELQKDIDAERSAWYAAQQAPACRQRSSCSSVTLPATPGALSPPDSPGHPTGSNSNDSNNDNSCGSDSTGDGGNTPEAIPRGQGRPVVEWVEPVIGVFVVHNKLKQKNAQLPLGLMSSFYFSGGDIEDNWVIYPWDAEDVWQHTDLAHSPTSATQSLISSPSAAATAAAADPMVC